MDLQCGRIGVYTIHFYFYEGWSFYLLPANFFFPKKWCVQNWHGSKLSLKLTSKLLWLYITVHNLGMKVTKTFIFYCFTCPWPFTSDVTYKIPFKMSILFFRHTGESNKLPILKTLIFYLQNESYEGGGRTFWPIHLAVHYKCLHPKEFKHEVMICYVFCT